MTHDEAAWEVKNPSFLTNILMTVLCAFSYVYLFKRCVFWGEVILIVILSNMF